MDPHEYAARVKHLEAVGRRLHTLAAVVVGVLVVECLVAGWLLLRGTAPPEPFAKIVSVSTAANGTGYALAENGQVWRLKGEEAERVEGAPPGVRLIFK